MGIDVELRVPPNMVYMSRLELFAPFNAFDRVVARWDNVISGKINTWFS